MGGGMGRHQQRPRQGMTKREREKTVGNGISGDGGEEFKIYLSYY